VNSDYTVERFCLLIRISDVRGVISLIKDQVLHLHEQLHSIKEEMDFLRAQMETLIGLKSDLALESSD